MVLRFNGCDRNREFYLYIQLYTQFVNPEAGTDFTQQQWQRSMLNFW